MTKSTITLVLGAGASAPYGFPTAEGLKEQILGLVDSHKLAQCAETLEYSPTAIRRFLPQFQGSSWPSIDRFLSLRPDLVDVGKMLIAYLLLSEERRVRSDQAAIQRRQALDRDWYGFLFNYIVRPSTPDDLVERLPTIVTFNYDRSLEWFLFTTLQSNFCLSDAAAVRVVESLDIIHVHGALGRSVLDFGADGRAFSELAQNPVWLHLPNDESKRAVEARRRASEAIANATTVVALGFGFDEDNVRRIGLQDMPPERKVLASCLGMTSLEQRNAILATGNRGNLQFGSTQHHALEFLRANSQIFRGE